jgi:Domain of unknown function (DUF4424)
MSQRSSRQSSLAGRAFALLVTLLLFGSLTNIAADPGAASFALGGLQFRNESRISMVRENLRFDDESIGSDPESDLAPGTKFKVTAEYEFANSTNQAVTIRMAFPLPDDLCGAANSPYMNFAEDSFHVWIEGKEIKYAVETRAFRSQEYIPVSTKDLGKDYTGLLREFGIAPESCKVSESMSQAGRMKLLALGLLDKDTSNANWTVRRKYYWTQTFTAGKSTHVKIAYPAQMGYSDVYLGEGWDKSVIQATDEFWKDELTNTCGGAGLEKKVAGEMSQPEGFLKVYWLDFVLLTANYWNGPIKDFVLTVNTSSPHVSFCWNGPVKRPDATHIVATAHDFSPKRDLHIGFFQAY